MKALLITLIFLFALTNAQAGETIKIRTVTSSRQSNAWITKATITDKTFDPATPQRAAVLVTLEVVMPSPGCGFKDIALEIAHKDDNHSDLSFRGYLADQNAFELAPLVCALSFRTDTYTVDLKMSGVYWQKGTKEVIWNYSIKDDTKALVQILTLKLDAQEGWSVDVKNLKNGVL